MGCQNKLVVARLNGQVAHGNGGEMVAFKLRPAISSVDRDPKSELGAEKKKIRLHQVLLDDMRVTVNAFRALACNKRRPRFAVNSCLEKVRLHLAKAMSIKRGISGAAIEMAGLAP